MTGRVMVPKGATAKRLLDLCCCEGGASRGYARAGFSPYGVDLFDGYTQARYPYPSTRGDAVEYVREHGHRYDLIHASPPCQHASAGTRAQDRSKYPRLIEPLREALVATGKPYVIENVRDADLVGPIELCGCMFGLQAKDEDGVLLHMWRPRQFESNMPISAPRRCDHRGHENVAGAYGGARRVKRRPGDTLETLAPRDRHSAKHERHGGYVPRSKAVLQELMGIDWMTVQGMYQALPPVYTEHIGRQIMGMLR